MKGCLQTLTEKRKIPQLIELVTDENGKTTLNFNLHDGQRDALLAKERFVLMLCGAQSGKTSFAPIWLMQEINNCGAGDYLVVSATFDLFNLKFRPELDNLFVKYLGYTYNGATQTFSKTINKKVVGEDGKIVNKQEQVRIICRSADSTRGLESATAKAVVFDEAGMPEIKVDIWEAIRRRLSLSRGRCLFTTTPYNLGWLKTEIYDKCVDPLEPDYKLINFKSTYNPMFSKEEFEDLRKSMPEWKFRMFYEGEFTRPASMIYDCFDFTVRPHTLEEGKFKFTGTKGNLIKPFTIPDNWTRYIGVDFGSVNSCVVFVASPPNNEDVHIVYHALLGGGTLYEKVLEYNKEYIGFGGAESEDDWRQQWAINGIPIKKPRGKGNVEAGINRVYTLIKRGQLFVFDTCQGVLKELRDYSREVDEIGNPTEAIANKNKYHHMDALRYVCSVFFYEEEEEDDRKPQRIIVPGSVEDTNRFFKPKYSYLV